MFEWLISLVPWWAWLALAIAAVVAVHVTFGWKAAMGAVIGILPVLGLLYGRKQGAEAERAKSDRDAINHVRVRHEVEDDVAEMGAQDIDQNMARWNRND